MPPIDLSHMADHLTTILIAGAIAMMRFDAWKTGRELKKAAAERTVTQSKVDSVHTLVNGRTEAANAKIAELTASIAELKQEKAALVSALAGKILAPTLVEGSKI